MHEKRPDFPTFVIWLLVILVAMLATILFYASNSLFSQDPSEVTITADGEPLSWIVAKKHWNGSAYDRESTFVLYDEAGLLPGLVAEGAEIKVTMGGSIPDAVTLKEFSLESDERSVYGQQSLLRELVFYFGLKSGTFVIPADGSHPVRGYLLTCTWGENTCEYAIVVQVLPE